MGGNAQGEKKKGLRASGVLCTGVTMGASGVAGEMGFRFRAFSALRAHLFACVRSATHMAMPHIMVAPVKALLTHCMALMRQTCVLKQCAQDIHLTLITFLGKHRKSLPCVLERQQVPLQALTDLLADLTLALHHPINQEGHQRGSGLGLCFQRLDLLLLLYHLCLSMSRHM